MKAMKALNDYIHALRNKQFDLQMAKISIMMESNTIAMENIESHAMNRVDQLFKFRNGVLRTVEAARKAISDCEISSEKEIEFYAAMRSFQNPFSSLRWKIEKFFMKRRLKKEMDKMHKSFSHLEKQLLDLESLPELRGRINASKLNII